MSDNIDDLLAELGSDTASLSSKSYARLMSPADGHIYVLQSKEHYFNVTTPDKIEYMEDRAIDIRQFGLVIGQIPLKMPPSPHSSKAATTILRVANPSTEFPDLIKQLRGIGSEGFKDFKLVRQVPLSSPLPEACRADFCQLHRNVIDPHTFQVLPDFPEDSRMAFEQWMFSSTTYHVNSVLIQREDLKGILSKIQKLVLIVQDGNIWSDMFEDDEGFENLLEILEPMKKLKHLTIQFNPVRNDNQRGMLKEYHNRIFVELPTKLKTLESFTQDIRDEKVKVTLADKLSSWDTSIANLMRGRVDSARAKRAAEASQKCATA